MNRDATRIKELATEILSMTEGAPLPFPRGLVEAIGRRAWDIKTIANGMDARTGRKDPSLRERVAGWFGR